MRSYKRGVLTVEAMVLAVASAGLGGCATLLNGTEQEVQVTSEPSGAAVTTERNASFTTPALIKLARKDNHWLMISHPGYHTTKVNITKEFNPTSLGNIILGGGIGAVADYASGAMARLTPSEAHVKLELCPTGQSPEVREWNPIKKSEPAPSTRDTPGTPPPAKSSPAEDTYKPPKSKQV